MITASILKEIAMRLEHDASSPIFLALMVSGKPYRLADSDMHAACERLASEINEAIRVQKNIEAAREIKCKTYSEFEDL